MAMNQGMDQGIEQGEMQGEVEGELWTAEITAYDDGTYGVSFENEQEEQSVEMQGQTESEEEGAEKAGEQRVGSLKEVLAIILEAAKNGGNANARQEEEAAFNGEMKK